MASSTQAAPGNTVAQGCPAISFKYQLYVLAVLWLVALFRFVDLQIIAVLLEPIRQEFLLSDTQLALLSGAAFALFYGLLGIPIARAADRFNRRNIIAAAVGLWSLMTALCGFASGFVSLFLARMGVGVGEAGAYPPTTSLLSDYFPESQRARVFAVLASAIPIGVFAGFLIGGVVSEYYGWRAAFRFVGLPGIALALLVHLTVRELPRGYSDQRQVKTEPECFTQSLRILLGIKAYRHLLLGACLFTLGAYGSGIWIPSYFIRHHGLGTAETGIWMAVLYGGGGLIGTLSGGWLAQRLSHQDGSRAWYMLVCSYSLLALLPFAGFVLLSGNPVQALSLHFLVTVLMHMNIGPVLASVQALAGIKRRAMAQAINVLVSNMIALPLGPLFVGLISDALTPVYGTKILGMAIFGLLVPAYCWAAWHFRCAAATLDRDTEAAQLHN